MMVKASQLYTSGWCDDDQSDGTIEPSPYNMGFQQRSRMFREEFDPNKPYRAEGSTFVSNFRHVLSGITKPLPPSNSYLIILKN
jgi:hypothetical protein